MTIKRKKIVIRNIKVIKIGELNSRMTDEKKKKYTVEDFIKRLEQLPKDLPITGYIFQTDDGEIRNTFEMGRIK